jgi:hypothetical protein
MIVGWPARADYVAFFLIRDASLLEKHGRNPRRRVCALRTDAEFQMGRLRWSGAGLREGVRITSRITAGAQRISSIFPSYAL